MDYGYIVNKGQGGFLNPPTHPEHTHSVWCGPRNNPTSCMSLSAAVDSEWLSPATRAAAKSVLDSWQRPALESTEVQEWVLQVLGYFHGCYRGDGPEPKCWHTSDLRICPRIGPEPSPDDHAGVHLIREYYPEFVTTPEHFAGAYWGKKPEKS